MPASYTLLSSAALTPAQTMTISDTLLEFGEDNAKSGFQNLGAGNDSFTYSGVSWFDPIGHRTYTFYTPQSVNGGGGDDRIVTGNADDTIHGGSGNDALYGAGGDDTLTGGSGADFVQGGEGRDTLSGGSGEDWLVGDTGNDRLNGGSGDDLLYGDDVYARPEFGGNDTLSGGAGNDTLFGGQWADTLRGGSGADHFAFHLASESSLGGRDRITDFSRAEGDRIDLRLLEHSGQAEHFSFGASANPASVWLGAVGRDASGHATQTVYLNTHGGGADMAVDVTLGAGMTGLNAGDFLL